MFAANDIAAYRQSPADLLFQTHQTTRHLTLLQLATQSHTTQLQIFSQLTHSITHSIHMLLFVRMGSQEGKQQKP